MDMRSLILPTLAALGLVGCTTVPQQKLAISPSTATRIAVLPVGTPERAEVTVIHSTGETLGLVGALVDGARFNAHEKTLSAVLAQEHFNFQEEIAQGVDAAIEEDGYQLAAHDGMPSTTKGRVKWQTPAPDVKDSDYVLDVVFDYVGYAADWDSNPYLPAVAMKARLTDRLGKRVFFTRIVYNPALSVFGEFDGPKIPADAKFAFGSMGDIRSDPAKAAQGIKLAVQSVLDELRRQLYFGTGPGIAKSN
jgi:hypothetical protein